MFNGMGGLPNQGNQRMPMAQTGMGMNSGQRPGMLPMMGQGGQRPGQMGGQIGQMDPNLIRALLMLLMQRGGQGPQTGQIGMGGQMGGNQGMRGF